MEPPPVVRRLAVLLAVEGLAVFLVGVVYAVVSAVGSPEDRLAAELAAGTAVLVGLALGGFARATLHARRWPRSPAVVLNVIALPVGYGLLQGHVWAAGVPVVVLAVAVLYLYSTGPAREALNDPR